MSISRRASAATAVALLGAAESGRPISPAEAEASATDPLSPAEVPDWRLLTRDDLIFRLFDPRGPMKHRLAGIEFLKRQRRERMAVLADALEDARAALRDGPLADVPEEARSQRAADLVSFAVAELRRPFTEPQMLETVLCDKASLRRAFLRMAAMNVAVCSAARSGRFGVHYDPERRQYLAVAEPETSDPGRSARAETGEGNHGEAPAPTIAGDDFSI